MKIIQDQIPVKTRGNTDVLNITEAARRVVKKSGLSNGSLLLFIGGSTASFTTIEYEPNLVKDLKAALDRLVPEKISYAHTMTWGDHNGHSHIRASLMGPSLQIPFADGDLLLGTWQQIIFIDFDTSPRQRKIIAQLTGE